MVEDLGLLVRQARQQLDQDSGRALQVVQAGQAAEADIARLGQQAEVYARVAALFTTVGEQAQETARGQFEALATHALQVIFGERLSFHLVAGETGGQATLEPVIRSEHDGTVIETGALGARGGGMVAVTGFIMQLVMVLLTPGVRKVLFLDETFAHVPVANREAVARFLREIADRAKVQIVMVTHDPVYAEFADAEVRFAPGAHGHTVVSEGSLE
jgi:hypothetical protein